MKKLFAASLAAFFVFTAAGCGQAAQTQTLPAQELPPESSAQQSQTDETADAPQSEKDNIILIMPDGEQPVDNSDWSWLDEPETVQTDLEEIVSCTYTLPHLTLHTQEATDTANAVFDELSQTVLRYAHSDIAICSSNMSKV